MAQLPLKASSTYNEQQVREYLDQAVIPMRLACLTQGSDQLTPLVASHWFLFEHDRLYGLTHKDAAVCRHLDAHPQCGFEIAADTFPYRGVRGQGIAKLEPDNGGKFLDALMNKYAIPSSTQLGRFLTGRAADERVIVITPLWLTSWDFSERMADIPKGT